MLVLTRDQKNDTILIGEDIRVTVTHTTGSQVKVLIVAPESVSVWREELLATTED